MEILQANHITKRFPGVCALDDVTISFSSGRIHGIVGENGAGKSTLIKVLTGLLIPEEGDIIIEEKNAASDRRLFQTVGYVPQELDQFMHMTVADNLFLPYVRAGISQFVLNKKDLYQKAQPWLDRFYIKAKPGDQLGDVSVSERQLLQIARSLVDVNTKILLLDEPTTSLTTEDTERLFKVLFNLRDEGKSIVFISHKLEEVFRICDDVTVFRNGHLIAKAETKDVSIPWTIENMIGRKDDASVKYRSERVSDEGILTVEGLTGEKFKNVSFTLHKGEILGIAGLVGAGRTEVMQAIHGVLPVYSGRVVLGSNKWKYGNPAFAVEQGFIYLTEERKSQGIFPRLSVQRNSTVTLLRNRLKNMFISNKQEQEVAKEIVDAYDVKTPKLSQEIRLLSGGNQQKVLIGRAMYTDPRVLVFDEPTKGIDIGTKLDIYLMMKRLAEENQVGIILISSELNEVMRCSNRILSMYDGSINGEFSPDCEKQSILNAIMGI